MMKPTPIKRRDTGERWINLGAVSAVGRSRLRIRCTCGAAFMVFIWSFAGHGKARCPGCQRWAMYDGRIFEDIPPPSC